MLNAAQRRFNRSRAGSVLILVVALLVLMALIGTAFMTMAQTDRGASAQHNFNTEADLLLEGAVNVVKSTVISDLFSAGAYRPLNETTTYQTTTSVGSDSQAVTAEQVTSPVTINTGTPFLADRLPSTDAMSGQVAANVIGGSGPYWRFLTSPLMGGQYETPLWYSGFGGEYARDGVAPQPNQPWALPSPNSAEGPAFNIRWAPTSVTLNGQLYPALQALYPDGTTYGAAILAADTDGDGIADAHFVKMATIDGITYYAAFRIVDNAAAFNVNTAWMPNTAITPIGDIFPTNVNLQTWLSNPAGQSTTGDNINYLNAYRFNIALTPPSNTPPLTFPVSPYQDYNNSAPRGDFAFDGGGYYDALWMQLGRRLDDPGFSTVPTSPQSAFQSLPATEAINLAERFCLRDPSSLTYPSFLEGQTGIPNSMGTNPSYAAAAVPYAVNDPTDWYNQNFCFASPASQINALPLRSILTVRNPVTAFVPNPFNIVPQQIGIGGNPTGTNFGDIVTLTTTASNNTTSTRAYAFIGSAIGSSPLNLSSPAFRWDWVPMPWSTAPTKISAQTATWGQLMMAYWAVMYDKTSSNGVFVPAGTDTKQFYSPLRNPYEVEAATLGTSRPAPPVPPTNPTANTVIPPSEVIKLRAALAAVNAIDLRDQDYNVTSERLILSATLNNVAGQPVEATVYGNEAQPYITRVYCENDNVTTGTTTPTGNGNGQGTGQGTPQANPQGYVGVELYNPYPFNIDITSWNLGILQGRVTSGGTSTLTYPGMKLMAIPPLTTATGFNKTANVNTIIPKQGYLILENYPNGLTGSSIDATYRPTIMNPTTGNGAATVNYCFVSNLSQVMQDPGNPTGQPGGELVLLRPRQAAMNGNPVGGTLQSTQLAKTAEYDEVDNLYDLVPLDSFDFTGIALAAKGAATFTGYYYSRYSGDSTTANWRFVYPGRWDPNLYKPQRQEGIESQTWTTPGQTDTVMSSQKAFGPFGSAGTPTYVTNYPPIQLNNYGFAGPGSVSSGTQSYPFGGFTRNLDILEAPYIGSYRLRILNNPPFNSQSPTPGQPIFPHGNDPSYLLELNPVTMDCQQADDYDTLYSGGTDDQFENIGRFCPIDGLDTSTTKIPVNDFALGISPPPGTTTPSSSFWRYHWAMKLADYLTVESPQDEQFPLMDASFPSIGTPPQGTPPQGIVHNTSGTTPAPQSYGQVATPASTTGFTATVDLNPNANYVGLPIEILSGGSQGQMSTVTSAAPTGTANQWTITFSPALQSLPITTMPQSSTIPPPTAQYDQFVIYGPPEETAALNGLVNVNTAPWPVLAGVPMVLNAATAGLAQNVAIAQSIVYYRDINDSSGASPPHGHGPFKTLFELNDVPVYSTIPPNPLPPQAVPSFRFRDAIGNCQQTVFDSAHGNYTNTGQTGTTVQAGDFQGTFLMINRVSNMLTTHSDSFTAYVEIQGWQNAETASPVLKVTRRATILIDRSKVTPVSQTVNTTNVPVN